MFGRARANFLSVVLHKTRQDYLDSFSKVNSPDQVSGLCNLLDYKIPIARETPDWINVIDWTFHCKFVGRNFRAQQQTNVYIITCSQCRRNDKNSTVLLGGTSKTCQYMFQVVIPVQIISPNSMSKQEQQESHRLTQEIHKTVDSYPRDNCIELTRRFTIVFTRFQFRLFSAAVSQQRGELKSTQIICTEKKLLQMLEIVIVQHRGHYRFRTVCKKQFDTLERNFFVSTVFGRSFSLSKLRQRRFINLPTEVML